MSQGGGAAFSVALQLCAKVRWRGPGLGWEEGWAAPPCWIWVCLHTRQQLRPRRVSPGMLQRCLAAGRFAMVRDRHCLDKLMSDEQRSQGSKVWGRDEARVVTRVNLSRYSLNHDTLYNGSSAPAVLYASVPTGSPSYPAGPIASVG